MSATHRLLYRGALSLPDSLLLLDGVTFFSPVLGTGINLLQNPLALALESMRGRPSLSFVRVEKLRDLSLDTSGDIQMDIHPDAVLSHIFFENTFCVLPCESLSKEGRSDVGVRVSLGDAANIASSSTAPGTTEMVIYARPSEPATEKMQTAATLQLCVARITPHHPPPTRERLPRPDDPTPRRPPLVFGKTTRKRLRSKEDDGRMLSLAGTDKGKGKQIKPTPTTNGVTGPGVIPDNNRTGKSRATDVARLGSGVRLGKDAAFKLPAVPEHRRGEPSETGSLSQTHANIEEIEKANKTLIKKTAVARLAARGISRTHPEFTDLYGFVYRGAAFALRTGATAQTSRLDRGAVDHMVEAHVRMYVRDGTDASSGRSMVS